MSQDKSEVGQENIARDLRLTQKSGFCILVHVMYCVICFLYLTPDLRIARSVLCTLMIQSSADTTKPRSPAF